MASNFRRVSRLSPSSTMSQESSAKLQLPMNNSSDDELPSISFKLSALTNALLEKENLLQEASVSQQYQARGNELTPNCIYDNLKCDDVERQPTPNSSRIYEQIRSPEAIGRGLPESDNTKPTRIVRVKPKAPETPNASTYIESQLDGSIPGELVVLSPLFCSSNLKAENLEASGAGSQKRGTTTAFTSSRDFQRSTSSLPRFTNSAGTAILGPARRFRRTEFDEFSPGDKIIHISGTGGMEESEHQSERHNDTLLASGTNQSQSQVIPLKHTNAVGSGIHKTDSDQSPNVLQYEKRITSLPDKHMHPALGQEEKQNATPSFISTQRKAPGDLGINNHCIAPLPPPPKMSVLEMATKSAGAAAASGDKKRRIQMIVKNKAYQRLECIGRGGSCRVYRVMSEKCEVLALKKVSLVDVDEQAVRGFKGEIELLTRLSKVDRVVQLQEWEVNDVKQTLSMLMECGEVDLDSILKRHIDSEHPKFNAGFTQFYWKEMLSCVAAIHYHNVVHSDLKPANFLLVNGSLKLIDFGIANAIQDNTINVHREHQVGTPNYMAPEALTFTSVDITQPDDAGKLVKIGKPSDIWSLGCILYLMLYGQAPFAQCRDNLQKAMLITNPHHAIAYPCIGIGGARIPSRCIETLKRCLSRDQYQRPAIEALLSNADQLLFPGDETRSELTPRHEQSGGISEEQLGMILQTVISHCRTSGLPTDPEMVAWPKYFYENIKFASAGETDLNAGLKTVSEKLK